MTVTTQRKFTVASAPARPIHIRAKCRVRTRQIRKSAPCVVAARSELATSRLSEKQLGIEADALRVFEQHLKQSPGRNTEAVPLELLQDVVSTKRVQPQLALGAAVQLEHQANSDQGA